MAKKLVSLVVCILVLTMTVPTCGANANMLVNGGFEDSDIAWEYCSVSDGEFFEGSRSGSVSNPLGPPASSGLVPHVSDYIYPVSLSEGTLYKFSMYIKCSDGGFASPVGEVYYSRAANRIVFNIKNIPGEWKEVTGFFVAGKSGEFDLGVMFFGKSADTVFYMDSLSLVPLPHKPVSMEIYGPRNVLIPSAGQMTYEYTAVALDKYGMAVPILTGGIQPSTSMPSGTSFNSETQTLTVDSSTLPGTMIKLMAVPPAGAEGVKGREITVLANYNHVTNGTFDDLPQYSGWEYEDGSFSIVDGAAKVNMLPAEENVYFGSMTASNTIVLKSGVMYVFRARVRSGSKYDSRQVIMPPPAVGPDGVIDVYIRNISRDWSSVFSVIRVPVEGIYQLKINFLEAEDIPVYIDDIGIYEEYPRATDVIFSAPAHVSIPSSGELKLPINYAVRDQESRLLPDEPTAARVEPEGRGVYLSGKNLVVTSKAYEGNYKIIAVSETDDDVSGSHTVNISRESVGDGSFENQAPGQWWASAAPSKFNIVTSHGNHFPTDGVKLGRLTLNGSVSALLCDSYKKYSPGTFVFEAMMLKVVPDIDTVVTLIIDNAESDSFEDNLVVAQFPLAADQEQVKQEFNIDKEITGRLMIAFNTPPEHDSQVVLMDDIKISDAAVSASNVRITGLPYIDMVLTGRYTFVSNFNAVDTSSYRWLISSTQNGAYIPIAGQTGQTLSITPDLIDKYVKFEVTPSSLSGPVFGQSVASDPVRIYSMPTGSGSPNREDDYPDDEVPPDSPIVVESDLVINTGGELCIYNIYKVAPGSYENTFFDMTSHWAYEDVKIMSAAGIANGRGDGLFMPSELITRAEFCAFLIRAFALAPLRYTGGFSDVEQWHWYSGIVETVTKYNIAQGTGDGLFSPETPITREQMTALVMRAYEKTGLPLATSSPAGFLDEDKISSWAIDSIISAANLDIIKGMPNGCFEPQRNATRAEAIVLIKRMITVLLANYAKSAE